MNVTKFCPALKETLALWQNRTGKQEVGQCDLILLQIFSFR